MSPLVLSAPPLLDVVAKDEQEAIQKTSGLLDACSDVIDAVRFLDAVLDRQRINPPILGNGIAMPHARTPWVREIVFSTARLASEVPFGCEGKPVRLVFLFGVPPHRISQYLAMTAALVKRLRDPLVIDGLLHAAAAEDFENILT